MDSGLAGGFLFQETLSDLQTNAKTIGIKFE